MADLKRIVGQNIALLEQARTLIARIADEDFRGPGSEGPGGGVGSQLRHVVDYYACFARDVRGTRIDYDARDRDPALEQDRERARSSLATLRAELESVGRDLEDFAVETRMECEGLPEEQVVWSASSVFRELQFLASHTVHHFALVALLLRQRGVEVPAEMGVAPSTLEYWKSSDSCAP